MSSGTSSIRGSVQRSRRTRRSAGPTRRRAKYYYPTSVLITSRDIITLRVLRMVLTGIHNVGQKPFDDVSSIRRSSTATARLSKSKGDGVDPIT